MRSPFRRLVHWGPLSSMAICISITIANMTTGVGLLTSLMFQFTMSLCLYNMWCATLLGPGYYTSAVLSAEHDGNNDQGRMNQDQGEQQSGSVTALTGRFCRRCCQIVLNKHHHCPWINNCVGHNNDGYFIRFLIFGMVASIQSMLILGLDTYQRYLIKTYNLFNVFNIGLSFGVLLSLSTLLYMH